MQSFVDHLTDHAPRPFSSLKKLVVETSIDAACLLIPCVTGVDDLTLHLYNSPGRHSSGQVFQAISKLSQLRKLTLRFRGTRNIGGQGLVTLAAGCSNLTSVSINFSDDEDYLNLSTHLADVISDSTIEEVARLLPALRHFHLDSDLPLFTGTALLHLGRNCHRIRSVSLGVDADLLKLAQDGSGLQFAQLDKVQLHAMGDRRHLSPKRPHHRDFWSVARRLAIMLPNVESLSLTHVLMKTEDGKHISLDQAVIDEAKRRRSLPGE